MFSHSLLKFSLSFSRLLSCLVSTFILTLHSLTSKLLICLIRVFFWHFFFLLSFGAYSFVFSFCLTFCVCFYELDKIPTSFDYEDVDLCRVTCVWTACASNFGRLPGTQVDSCDAWSSLGGLLTRPQWVFKVVAQGTLWRHYRLAGELLSGSCPSYLGRGRT